jgi:sRNA-binding carbon storage regulator CsrA
VLILTRNPGQSIKIGDDIRITVLLVYEKRIKIRVQTSDDTGIYIRLGEEITIRDGITITLTNIDESQVKLGIEAPVGVKINRE